jgi:hypothetical protein
MSISAAHADAFVSEALGPRKVWGIRDEAGFPTSTNPSGEIAMPFWSSESRAKKITDSVSAYAGFKPTPIDLAVFIERWLPGLEKDGLRCGLNWSGERATGYDLKPSEVLARLLAAGA